MSTSSTKNSGRKVEDYIIIQKIRNFENNGDRQPHKVGYIPQVKEIISKTSGVTVATGFDIGQRTHLDDFIFTPAIKAKFKPYLNMIGQTAYNKLKKIPLVLTQQEVELVEKEVLQTYFKQLERRIVERDKKDIDKISKEVLTVLFSLDFLYGNGQLQYENVWNDLINDRFEGPIKFLEKNKDNDRKLQEAGLIRQVLQRQTEQKRMKLEKFKQDLSHVGSTLVAHSDRLTEEWEREQSNKRKNEDQQKEKLLTFLNNTKEYLSKFNEQLVKECENKKKIENVEGFMDSLKQQYNPNVRPQSSTSSASSQNMDSEAQRQLNQSLQNPSKQNLSEYQNSNYSNRSSYINPLSNFQPGISSQIHQQQNFYRTMPFAVSQNQTQIQYSQEKPNFSQYQNQINNQQIGPQYSSLLNKTHEMKQLLDQKNNFQSIIPQQNNTSFNPFANQAKYEEKKDLLPIQKFRELFSGSDSLKQSFSNSGDLANRLSMDYQSFKNNLENFQERLKNVERCKHLLENYSTYTITEQNEAASFIRNTFQGLNQGEDEPETNVTEVTIEVTMKNGVEVSRRVVKKVTRKVKLSQFGL